MTRSAPRSIAARAAIWPTAAAAPDRDHVAAAHAAQVRAHPAGRRGVGGEQGVGRRPRRVRERAVVDVRDPDVLGVAALEPARWRAVAEDAAGLVAEELCATSGLGLPLSHSDHRSCVQYQHRPQPMKEHTTTRSPTLCSADRRTDLDDLAHELVADHVARAHRRDVAAEQVQVGSARRVSRTLTMASWSLRISGRAPVPREPVHALPAQVPSQPPLPARAIVARSTSLPAGRVASPAVGRAPQHLADLDQCLALAEGSSVPLTRVVTGQAPGVPPGPPTAGARSRAAISVPFPPGATRIRTSMGRPTPPAAPAESVRHDVLGLAVDGDRQPAVHSPLTLGPGLGATRPKPSHHPHARQRGRAHKDRFHTPAS